MSDATRPAPSASGRSYRNLWHEAAPFVVLAAIYLCSFGALWVAATVAGGRPRATLSSYAGQVFDVFRHSKEGEPWRWVAAEPGSRVVFWAFLLGMSAALGGLVLGVYWTIKGGRPIYRTNLGRRQGTNRSARFAKPSDLRKLRVSGPTPNRPILGYYGGAVLSGLYAALKEVSIVIVGPTRSGKTVGFLIPMIIEHYGPVVATSTKPDIIERTIGWRSHVGKVFVYDPTGATKLSRIHVSHIRGCADIGVALRRGSDIGATIGKSNKSDSGGTLPYFRESGKKLLGALFYLAAISDQSMRTVKVWIDSKNSATMEAQLAYQQAVHRAQTRNEAPPAGPVGQIDAAFARARSDNLGESRSLELAWQIFDEIESRHAEERLSAYSTCGSALSVFLEPAVAESAEYDDFDIDAFITDGRNTLYLVAPVDDQHRVAPLFTGLIGAIKQRVYQLSTEQGGAPIEPALMLALDEVANIAPLEELGEMASQGLSQGLKLVCVFQNLSQAVQVWGEPMARSIVDSHQCKIALPGITDPYTTEYLSTISGSEEHERVTVSGGQRSVTKDERVIVPPGVFRTMSDRQALIVHTDFPLFYVEQRRYYEDPTLTAQSAMQWYGAEHQDDDRLLAQVPAHPGRAGLSLRRVLPRSR